MTPLLEPAKPLDWNMFKEIDTLTLPECINNILFLKYLLYKEDNALVRQKLHCYIDQLTLRLLELLDREEAPLNRSSYRSSCGILV